MCLRVLVWKQAPRCRTGSMLMKILAWAVLLACSPLFAQSPERVVVLDVAAADTLQALGEGERIIAAPKAQLPAYLMSQLPASVVDTGQPEKPAFSRLRQLKPDAIYAPALSDSSQAALQNLAPTHTLAFAPAQYWSDFNHNVLSVAEPHGKTALAQQRLNRLQQQMVTLREQIAQEPRSLVVLEHRQGHYRWQAQAAYQALLYDVLRIKRPVNLPKQSLEVTQTQLQQWQPDVLWVIDLSAAPNQQSVDVSVLEEAARTTPALATGRIKMLNAPYWPHTAVGLQGMQGQLDEVARLW